MTGIAVLASVVGAVVVVVVVVVFSSAGQHLLLGRRAQFGFLILQ